MRMGLPTDKWKTSLEAYCEAAVALCTSMGKTGFSPEHPVPVDPEGELLDGSHRVACAIALGIKDIPVVYPQRHVWAPPWDEDWFIAKGLIGQDLIKLKEDFRTMRGDGGA